MGFLKFCFALLCILSLYGCKTIQATNPIAVVIPKHTTESIAEIRSIITNALNGVPVTISGSAFSKTNKLILERKKIMGPDGRVIQTTIVQEPIIFEIFIIEDTCYLKSLGNHGSFQLTQAKCVKMKKNYDE